jgi:hypothetical protein
MSLLSSFITNQLIKSLEHQFLAHEPELQEAFVNEVAEAVSDVVAWLNSKLSTSQPVEALNEEGK